MNPTPAQMAILKERHPGIGEPALRRNAAALLGSAEHRTFGIEQALVKVTPAATFPLPTESKIQQRIIKWWAMEAAQRKIPESLLMAFPLQGQRSKANGSRMKAEGMRAGTPDMFLAVPMGKYHGLWIELKRPTGRIAPSQKTMLAELDAQGYAAYASYGFDAAVKLITGYLAGDEFF